jgi:small subunit ribosomal protein S8
MTDPIADFLTRIRNASRALLPTVEMPHSRMKESIARVFKQEGYIADCAASGAKLRKLTLKLKYSGRKGVIEGLRRVSRPGLRHYKGADEMPRVLGGLGVAVVSTSRGIMTGTEARKQKLGGEVVCYIW